MKAACLYSIEWIRQGALLWGCIHAVKSSNSEGVTIFMLKNDLLLIFLNIKQKHRSHENDQTKLNLALVAKPCCRCEVPWIIYRLEVTFLKSVKTSQQKSDSNYFFSLSPSRVYFHSSSYVFVKHYFLCTSPCDLHSFAAAEKKTFINRSLGKRGNFLGESLTIIAVDSERKEIIAINFYRVTVRLAIGDLKTTSYA